MRQERVDRELNRQAARHLRQAGWTPVLLKPGQKTPAMKDWQTKVMDGREVDWWCQRYKFGIGVLLGAAGALVLDKDAVSREAYNWLRKHKAFDRSPMEVVTSKGTHSYWKLPDTVEDVRSRIGFLGMKLDVLMGARVAVVPPTFVAETEHRYSLRPGKAIVSPGELPVLPESVVELLNAKPRPGEPRLSKAGGVRRGKVNNPRAYALRIESHQGAAGSGGLVRCIAVLRDEGWSPHDIYEFLRSEWNRPPRVTPPWSDGELRYAVRRHTT